MPTRNEVANKITPTVMVIEWSGLLLNDDGRWFVPSEHPDRTWQVFGTFGGATIRFEGSNDYIANDPNALPTNAFTLTDQVGVPLSFTAAGGRISAEASRWVRPFVVGGDGTTNLTVRLVARR